MSYRPITDIWLLARCKYKNGIKRYGGYLGGFPERARVLIGAGINEPVLHVCGGMAKHYPYARGFGPNDETLDLDPATEPNFLQDAREPLPAFPSGLSGPWAGHIIDPPYSEPDADHYACGRAVYPAPNLLVMNAIDAVPIGRRIGIIHYMVPRCPQNAKFIALVGINCGFNNRIRAFSVYERIS